MRAEVKALSFPENARNLSDSVRDSHVAQQKPHNKSLAKKKDLRVYDDG